MSSPARTSVFRWMLLVRLLSLTMVAGVVVWVQDDDPRITYQPSLLRDGASVCQNHPSSASCRANWWPEFSTGANGTMHWTCGQGNNMSYTFQGTEIAWFTRPGDTNNPLNFTIDHGPVKQVVGGPAERFRATGLDPSKPHTIVAASAGRDGKCLGFDYMQVTIPDSIAPTLSALPSPTISTIIKYSRADPGDFTAGSIVGSIIALAIIIGAIAIFFYKRRARPENLEEGRLLAEGVAGDISYPSSKRQDSTERLLEK